MTLGTGGRGPQARSIPQGPAVLAVAQAPFWVRQLQASKARKTVDVQKVTLGHWSPGPQEAPVVLVWHAKVFSCFVKRPPKLAAAGFRQASFLVGSESDVRHWGPWPAGPVRPSGPCCLAVAQAPFWVRQL